MNEIWSREKARQQAVNLRAQEPLIPEIIWQAVLYTVTRIIHALSGRK